MRISGTEPSSVILSQTKKMKNDAPKVPKQVKAKGDGVIYPKSYDFNQFQVGKILILSKRYESIEFDRRTYTVTY